MKYANDSGVAPLEHADNPALAAAIGLRRLHFNQHLVALHGAIDLVRGNEDIFLTGGLAAIGADKSEAVSMQIQAAGRQVLPGAQGPGNAPVLSVQLGQRAAHCQAGQLLQQQTPLPSACQSKLADQLLVSGLAAGRAGYPRHQFTIGHRSRVGYFTHLVASRLWNISRAPQYFAG